MQFCKISPVPHKVMWQNVIFILCQLPSFVGARNPRFFPCDSDVNLTAVDCSHRPLINIPQIRSDTVVSLNLGQTKITKVGRNAFSGVPNLTILKINWNCMPFGFRTSDNSYCKMDIQHDAFKDLDKLESLNLSGNGLTSLPWLPKSLKTLDLERNHIFNIEHPFNTPHLQQLFLTYNCFYANPCNRSFHIHEDVFRELTELQNLTLGYNNLTSVPTGLPPSLMTLDLRENTITEILDGAFANLTCLKRLILEWNCQRCDHAARTCIPCPNNDALKLHPNSLNITNSSIEYLSLRGNSLNTFPEGLFKPLKRLQRLDLSDNFLIDAIENGTFFSELNGLTWLSLIYNYEPNKTQRNLTLSPHLGNLSELRYLLLSGNFFLTLSSESLEVLSKLRNLESLELRMNFINSINMSALRQLPALTKVDLSQNILTFLPRCSYLSSKCPSQQSSQNQNWHTFRDFTDPPLILMDRKDAKSDTWEPTETNVLCNNDNVLHKTIWDFKYCFCQSNLTYYDLSQNDILSLNQAVFVGMENAVCLDLSYNYMSQALRKGPFSNMKNLVYLNMAYNRIDLYYPEAFSELQTTLKVLDLSNNDFHFQLKGMGHSFGFLQNLAHLEVLSLANNGIGIRINKNLSSNSLKYLYFSGNHLNLMWDPGNKEYIHFFQNLVSLIYLDISQNELSSVSEEVVCNLPKSIQTLSISNNKLSYFAWRNITVLSKLRHLNLSGNHLDNLPNANLDQLEFGPNFTLLDLSHNYISTLPDDFFSKAKTLQSLYISHNSIKQLDQQVLPSLLRNGSALQKLALHANPFECNCDASSLADFLQSSPVDIPYLTTKVLCEFPESMQKSSVLSIDHRSCQEIYGSIAFLFTSFLAVACTVFPMLKHLYGWDLWYGLQVLWAGYKGYSQLPGSDLQKQYDAFIVFDTENPAVRDWVYNEFIVQMETVGHRRFCLCLEERDWIPGVSCIENLHNAVYSSVKTVFVLSSGGSNAHGGEAVNGVIRQAFFMVQQRLLDEKMDVAVLVLLDETFPKMKYLQLRKRLCRKSVLSWPRNPRAQPLFWTRMRMALSLDNLRFYDSKMSESFI